MPSIDDFYYHLYEGTSLGKKPVIVLIHGAGGTHLYWPSDVRRLPGQRVYALDLPGHGKSGGRGRQSISAYADAVRDWLTALGIHSAVFVGHSMGSAIVLTLALDHPERVNGLVLVGAGARLKVSPQLMEAAESSTTYMNAVKLAVDWSFSAQAPRKMKELAALRMAETRSSVLHGDFRACSEFDETARVEQIRKPSLILCGAEDKMTPPRYSQYLAEKIPGAELVLLDEAGHMVQLEQPRRVSDSIQSFMTGIHY